MIKSQKGITLSSLTVYIIVLLMAISMISVISTNFFSNTKEATKKINPLAEYTKFTSFFTEEVNHENIKILECEDNYIVFDNGVQYTYIAENEGIYKDMVKICSDVKNCTFRNSITNGKDTIMVNIQIGNEDLKEVEYTLKK